MIEFDDGLVVIDHQNQRHIFRAHPASTQAM